jgi:hypothetical protein
MEAIQQAAGHHHTYQHTRLNLNFHHREVQGAADHPFPGLGDQSQCLKTRTLPFQAEKQYSILVPQKLMAEYSTTLYKPLSSYRTTKKC